MREMDVHAPHVGYGNQTPPLYQTPASKGRRYSLPNCSKLCPASVGNEAHVCFKKDCKQAKVGMCGHVSRDASLNVQKRGAIEVTLLKQLQMPMDKNQTISSTYVLLSWLVLRRNVLQEMVVYFVNWDVNLTDVAYFRLGDKRCLRRQVTSRQQNSKHSDVKIVN